MSNTGYEAPDKPGQSRPVLSENQERDRKAPRHKRKRPGVSRKGVSPSAQDMQRLKKIVDEAPEIRDDRVATAKQALQAGTLELRGEELAGKLLRDLLHKLSSDA
jgi:flagellar biosynthesis anti-sigma factor FlgM